MASRASPPVMNPEKRIARTKPTVTRSPPPPAPARGGNPVSPTNPLRAGADTEYRRLSSGEPAGSPAPPQGRATSSRGRLRQRVQVAAQLLQLVAELGGIFEAELLGRLEHLLLQGDDELLQLLARHALDLVGAATPAGARHMRL